MKYRRKPVEIEAVQFVPKAYPIYPIQPLEEAINTGDTFLNFPVWLDKRGPYLLLPQLDGSELRANPSDWIVTAVKTESRPIKEADFRAIYEAV